MLENLFIYEIDGGEIYGVVQADDAISARQKVEAAYERHCNGEVLSIRIYEQSGNWFPDAPDVLEVYSV